MHAPRSTPVALLLTALVASAGGAQSSTTKPAAPTAQQMDAAAAQFKSLGLLAYPAKGQSADKQKKDQAECYAWSKEQTGFDPATAAAVNTDSVAKAAQAQTAEATKGTAVKGAAKGAAAGALIGAAAGDAGKGAAIGAAAGGVGGRSAKKRADKQAGADAAASATGASNKQVDDFKKAIGTCMTGRGYTFSK